MRITQVSAAIEAFCHVARIANRVLNIRYFDSSALHALALYFDWRGRRRQKKRILVLTLVSSTEKVKAPIGYANAADVTRGHDDKYKNRKKIADMRLRFYSGNPKISNLHKSPHDYWALSW
jgi:hypothetical protein